MGIALKYICAVAFLYTHMSDLFLGAQINMTNKFVGCYLSKVQ